MSQDTTIIILIGVVFLAIGSFIGFLIAKKTKILDNFSQDSRSMNKILNDPDLLVKKIKESIKQINPNVEGEPEIWDNDTKIKLNVVEKDGKKVLEIERIKTKAPAVKPMEKQKSDKAQSA